MTRRIAVIKTFFVAGLLFLGSTALAYVSPGSPTGYVNDYARILTAEQKTTLEGQLREFDKTDSTQVSVVILQNLSGDYIENFAEKLFKEWGIGNREKDNGVLLLVSLDDRKLRIEVGYGLEGALPDATASAIIRNDITPLFKEGKYYEGVYGGVGAIMKAVKGEYVGVSQGGGLLRSISPDAAGILIFIGFIFLQWVIAILGRSKSWWLGGVLGGGIGAGAVWFNLFGLTFPFGLAVIGVLASLGLIFDYIVSRGYSKAIARGSRAPWWTGGGSSSGGGSSFGGFGGGSSGGGGASGDW